MALIAETSGSEPPTSNEANIALLKFTWEVYKVLLDFTKVNNKLLEHSQKILKSTFSFCKKYSLNTEFKRLCDSIRGYLQSLIKFEKKNVNIPNKVELNNLDVVKNLVQIRTSLLETAVELNQWQEAFKTAEDIVLLLNKLSSEGRGTKQQVPERQLFEYFVSLAKLFENSKYYLFAGFAQINVRQFFLKYEKRLKEEGNQKLKKTFAAFNSNKINNSIVLSAVLSVFDVNKQFIKLGMDVYREENQRDLESNERIKNILRMNFFPTREYLVTFIHNNHILEHCDGNLRELFLSLYKKSTEESSFILTVKKAFKLVETIKPNDNLDFNEAQRDFLKKGLISYGLVNMYKIYNSVSFKRLLNIFAPVDFSLIQDLASEYSIKGKLKVQFDHIKKLAFFQRPSSYDLNHCITQLDDIDISVNAEKVSAFKSKVIEIIDRREQDGLTIFQKRINRMREENLKSEKIAKARDNLIEELNGVNARADDQERAVKELNLENARREEQNKKQQKEIETQFKNYMIDKIQEFTNAITIESSKSKVKLVDLQKDLEKVTSDQLVQAFVEEEASNLEKKKNLHKIINKKIDYEERIKRKIELPKFSKKSEGEIKSIQENVKSQLARRSKCLEILGDNKKIVDGFFKQRLDEKQESFNQFTALRKQFSQDKSSYIHDQIFYFVFKDAKDMKEEYEKEEEKKGVMNMTRRDKKTENTVRGAGFKVEDKPVEVVSNFARSAKAVGKTDPPKENKEVSSTIVRGEKFGTTTKTEPKADSEGPPVFISSQKQSQPVQAETQPQTTGFNRAGISEKADPSKTIITRGIGQPTSEPSKTVITRGAGAPTVETSKTVITRGTGAQPVTTTEPSKTVFARGMGAQPNSINTTTEKDKPKTESTMTRGSQISNSTNTFNKAAPTTNSGFGRQINTQTSNSNTTTTNTDFNRGGGLKQQQLSSTTSTKKEEPKETPQTGRWKK
eukprot:CAMPEP_0170515600 /NCGR_PEP_ID=MMETSP0209-20121228/2010_1 /TAXON_ID=665100 ORGANISM="Litonotus pictus, Strain P1" /NCGR_SAMPLE_ID=MMETSP0209 /ASSEMBLY_ACC=CAM_ASM_000301 /LENGTH=961 /DNA_ID=CAMNT_0010800159 /DNA_START=367 /DNA_END=3252 /DNA_ORIENTATION=+